MMMDDLHRLLTVESATNPELNNIQACTGNLSSTKEGSILVEAFTNETTLESNTATSDNSSQINGVETLALFTHVHVNNLLMIWWLLNIQSVVYRRPYFLLKLY